MTPRTKGKGRSAEQADALQRTYGDLEVRDAKADLRIPVIAEDVKKAKRRDPERCVLAQACMREFASSAVVFFKSRAYVDLVGDDGVRRVERFIVNGAAREVVEAFDREEPVPAGGRWLVLKAPGKSMTLDAQRKLNRQYRAAVRRGEYTPARLDAGYSPRKRSTPRDLEVRNGQGQWQMLKRREDETAAA
jgi:hypothetical protein